MSIAYPYIMEKLDAALAEAEAWEPGTWSNCYEFLAGVQGSVRSSVSFGRTMFAFLDRVPYLTARLAIPGESRRAITQFDSVPEISHNRSSIAVYSKTKPSLRSAVELVRPDGSGISPVLQQEINGMNEISCDDTLAEEAHARMNRIVMAGRRGLFPFQSATLSLPQALEDVKYLPAVVEADPQKLWNVYGSVLQVKPRNYNRNLRCSRKAFEQKMY